MCVRVKKKWRKPYNAHLFTCTSHNSSTCTHESTAFQLYVINLAFLCVFESTEKIDSIFFFQFWQCNKKEKPAPAQCKQHHSQPCTSSLFGWKNKRKKNSSKSNLQKYRIVYENNMWNVSFGYTHTPNKNLHSTYSLCIARGRKVSA